VAPPSTSEVLNPSEVGWGRLLVGVPQLWCRACAPETLVTRTLGVVEALIAGRLCLRADSSIQQTAVVVGKGCLALSATTGGADR